MIGGIEKVRLFLRTAIGLALVAPLCLGALLIFSVQSPGTQGPISESQAISLALAAVEDLDRQRSRMADSLPITGFTLVSARLTNETAAVSDSHGNVLTVTSPPRQAWVVQLNAPRQQSWGSISAVAVVDSTSGIVRGTGLWPVPADRPEKSD